MFEGCDEKLQANLAEQNLTRPHHPPQRTHGCVAEFSGLIVQDNVEERAVDLQAPAIIVDEA